MSEPRALSFYEGFKKDLKRFRHESMGLKRLRSKSWGFPGRLWEGKEKAPNQEPQPFKGGVPERRRQGKSGLAGTNFVSKSELTL
jgi:hypothetical protein